MYNDATGKLTTPNGTEIQNTDMGYKVGDVITTTRTDLGNKWLQCNGQTIPRSLFPELSAVIPSYPNESKTGGSSANLGGLNIATKLKYINGYYIVCGAVRSGSNYIGSISYSTSLTSGWTIVNIVPSGSIFSVVNDIAYGDGYYVAVGGYSSSQSNCRSYSKSGTSLDAFDTVGVGYYGYFNQYYLHTWNSVIYSNGYFIIAGAKGVSPASYDTQLEIVYAQPSNLTAGAWTEKVIYTTTNGNSNYQGKATIYNIDYINNQYVVCGYYTQPTTSSYSATVGFIAYANDFTGDWTSRTIATASDAGGSGTALISKVIYVNGQYLFAGSSGTSYCVWSAPKINGSTVKRIIIEVDSSTDSTKDRTIYDLAYINGYFTVVGLYDDTSYSHNNDNCSFIACSADLVNWEIDKRSYGYSSNIYRAGLTSIFSQGTNLCFVGTYYNSSVYYGAYYYIHSSQNTMNLPYPIQNCLTYIKVAN